jgi:imidazolonepropionase-like amidohydrolase
VTVSSVLHGGLLFDGTGSRPEVLDVRVVEDRIVQVAPCIEGGETRIDLTGLSIIPGLIDCHVHSVLDVTGKLGGRHTPFSYQFYAAARHLERLLDCGITTVRDAGGADLGMKTAVRDGLIDGPDLSIAITILSQTGGHFDGWNVDGSLTPVLISHPGRPESVADGVDEVRRRTRELARAGADVIKICTTGGVTSERDHPTHTQFSPAEVRTVVEEANACGIPVMSHAQGKQGILNAVHAGVRSIEHGIYADDECFRLMKDRGTWLVPTLAAPFQLLAAADNGFAISPAVERKCREVQAIHTAMFARAVEFGIKIAMGSDSGMFSHGLNLSELELMVAAGMSPSKVLVSATSSAADLLGLSDRGSIQEGLRADFVVIDGDALDFELYPQRVRQVWKAGTRVRSN